MGERPEVAVHRQRVKPADVKVQYILDGTNVSPLVALPNQSAHDNLSVAGNC
jgi:hypothetical protein